jgi:capsular exopolysaccharide synthesis family protein
VTVGTNQRTELPRDEGRAPIREYVAILRLRKWSIILVTLVVVGAALAFSSQQDPVYASEARFLVKQVAVSATDTAGQLNMETEQELAASTTVASRVIEKLGLEDVEPKALLNRVTVDVVPATEILSFTVEGRTPEEALQLANAFANQYGKFRREEVLSELEAAKQEIQEQIANIEEELAGVKTAEETAPEGSPERGEAAADAASLQARLNLLVAEEGELADAEDIQVGQVIQPASLPLRPVSPDHVRNGVLALVVGLLLGIGLAFLRERLDDRLRGRQDLEDHLGAPVLAVVPRVSSWKRRGDTPLVTLKEPRAATAEAYRTLRTSLLFAASQRDAKVLLVTSPHAGEGKTATSVNLAVVLAQARKRVLLLSADLRKPRLHRFFGLSNDIGLTNILIGEAQPWDAVADVGMGSLKVVPSGPVPGHPAELLGSDAMGRLLEQFREVADFVILDSAPALVVADALTLAPFVDASLFVADAEHTTRGAVIHARNQLDQVNADVMGAVLNNFDPSKAKRSPYYYSYYYTYKYEDAPQRSGRLLRRRVGKDEGPYPAGQRRMTGFERGEDAAPATGSEEGADVDVGSMHRARMEGLWASDPAPEGNGEDRAAEAERPKPSARRRR